MLYLLICFEQKKNENRLTFVWSLTAQHTLDCNWSAVYNTRSCVCVYVCVCACVQNKRLGTKRFREEKE